MRKHFIELAKGNNVYIPEYKIDGTGRSIPDPICIENAPINIFRSTKKICRCDYQRQSEY